MAALVPGGEVVVGLVGLVNELFLLVKEANGLSAVCETLCERLDLLEQRLKSERAKLDDNGAIAHVIKNYLKTAEEFRLCLKGWIEYATKHSIKKFWKRNNVKGDIEKFDNVINGLHKELDEVHIVEMEKWRRADSEWKDRLKDELAQLSKQVAEQIMEHATDENTKMKEHVTDENTKMKDHMTDGNTKMKEHVTDENTKMKEHVTDGNTKMKEHVTD